MNLEAARRLLAITHAPSPKLEEGERTHIDRTSIDFALACRQHEAYCQMLRDCDAEVRVLDVNCSFPDSVFVEDTAIVLEEVAVMTSMGTVSRRAETKGIESELRKHREVECISLPGSIDGGDVLRIGRQLLVGLSSRTNRAGLNALDAIARRHGYKITPVPVSGCLHLKTACTALPDGTLIVNPAWLDGEALRGFNRVAVSESEPWAANVALVGATVCLAAEHKGTAEMIDRLGFDVRTVELSEFAKAEGGVTCLSLLLQAMAS